MWAVRSPSAKQPDEFVEEDCGEQLEGTSFERVGRDEILKTGGGKLRERYWHERANRRTSRRLNDRQGKYGKDDQPDGETLRKIKVKGGHHGAQYVNS